LVRSFRYIRCLAERFSGMRPRGTGAIYSLGFNRSVAM
jgi:hypothetical protein